MSTLTKRIHSIMESWNGHPFDLFMEISILLETYKDPLGPIIKEIITYPNPVGNPEAPLQNIDDDIFQRLSFYYYGFLAETAATLMINNPDEDQYYLLLSQAIFDANTLPQDPLSRAFYLFVLKNKIALLPYYPAINPLELSTDEFRDTISQIVPSIRKAEHFFRRKFAQKSEKVSQFWEIASTLKSREEQIVFWSVVLSFSENRQ